MFLVNSRLGLFTATSFSSSRKSVHLLEAILLPKLRINFAEFLSEGCLKRLGILSPPTCVGLRYGHLANLLEVFLGSMDSMTLRSQAPRHHLSRLAFRIFQKGHATGLDPHFQPGAHLSSCVTPLLKRCQVVQEFYA